VSIYAPGLKRYRHVCRRFPADVLDNRNVRKDRDNGPRGQFCHTSDCEYIVMRVVVRNGYTTARNGHQIRGSVRYKCSYRADTENRNMISCVTASGI